MRIIVDTDGTTDNTVISLNGEKMEGLKEFHFSMNPHKQRDGFVIKGKCKMQVILNREFRSYFAGDFKKYDEVVPKK